MSDHRVEQTHSVPSFFRIQLFAERTSENIFNWALLANISPFWKGYQEFKAVLHSRKTPVTVSVYTLRKGMELTYTINLNLPGFVIWNSLVLGYAEELIL